MKIAAGSFVAVLLSVLAFVALKHGWADLLAFQGRAVIKTWERNQQPLANDEWLLAQARLEKSLSLNPGDPSVSEELGRLHEIRARGAPSAASRAELQSALGYFRASAAARPTSPYTWANIAFTQSRLGVIDADFYRAIDNAALLGPWEPEVQLTLADIGFRYWDRLPKSARNTIHQAMHRALKRQDAKMFDLAVSYRRLDVMCATPEVYRSKRALRCI